MSKKNRQYQAPDDPAEVAEAAEDAIETETVADADPQSPSQEPAPEVSNGMRIIAISYAGPHCDQSIEVLASVLGPAAREAGYIIDPMGAPSVLYFFQSELGPVEIAELIAPSPLLTLEPAARDWKREWEEAAKIGIGLRTLQPLPIITAKE